MIWDTEAEAEGRRKQTVDGMTNVLSEEGCRNGME